MRPTLERLNSCSNITSPMLYHRFAVHISGRYHWFEILVNMCELLNNSHAKFPVWSIAGGWCVGGSVLRKAHPATSSFNGANSLTRIWLSIYLYIPICLIKRYCIVIRSLLKSVKWKDIRSVLTTEGSQGPMVKIHLSWRCVQLKKDWLSLCPAEAMPIHAPATANQQAGKSGAFQRNLNPLHVCSPLGVDCCLQRLGDSDAAGTVLQPDDKMLPKCRA